MRWIVKANFLLVGLGLVIYFMFVLRHRGLNPALATALGIQMPPKQAAVETPATPAKEARVARLITDSAASAGLANQLNWCETRVAGMIRPEKLKLAQVGGDWVIEEPDARKVDFIAVEKWFSSHCSVRDAAPVAAKADDESLSPLLLVKFVTGKVAVLRGDGKGHFDWNGQQFASADLLSALAELEHLPDSARK